MTTIHPRLKLWMDLGGLLADAAEASAKHVKKQIKGRRRGSYLTRRPGEDTPMWNACTALLREQLKPMVRRCGWRGSWAFPNNV